MSSEPTTSADDPKWSRTQIRVRIYGFPFLVVCAALALTHPFTYPSFQLTGPLDLVQAAPAVLLVCAALVRLGFGVYTHLRDTAGFAAYEDRNAARLWAADDNLTASGSNAQHLAFYLEPRVGRRRKFRLDLMRAYSLILAAATWWIYLAPAAGATDPGEEYLSWALAAALMSMLPALAGALALGATMADATNSGALDDIAWAAQRVSTEAMPAAVLGTPGGPTILTRLGVTTGSAHAYAAMTLAAANPTMPLADLIALTRLALNAPAS